MIIIFLLQSAWVDQTIEKTTAKMGAFDLLLSSLRQAVASHTDPVESAARHVG